MMNGVIYLTIHNHHLDDYYVSVVSALSEKDIGDPHGSKTNE